ncbi:MULTISPECIES: DUF443 family protein [Listeria]|uniref:DUF443 family protein n=1 Tax=Listeria TaxID=1637 RepID=UPI000B596F7F|nr:MULTISPECIES: DUF443 family protein [Listeria]
MNQEIKGTKNTQFKIIQYNNKQYIIDMASKKGWLASVFTWSRKKNAYLLIAEDKSKAILEKRPVDSSLVTGIVLSVVAIGGFSSRKYVNALDTNLSSLFSIILLTVSALLIFLSYFFVIKRNQQILKQLVGSETINIQIKSSSFDAFLFYMKNILIFLILTFFVVFGCIMFILYHSLIFYFIFIFFLLVCLYTGIGTMRLPKVYSIVVTESK